jgi:hypothetical protein
MRQQSVKAHKIAPRFALVVECSGPSDAAARLVAPSTANALERDDTITRCTELEYQPLDIAWNTRPNRRLRHFRNYRRGLCATATAAVSATTTATITSTLTIDAIVVGTRRR